ncbi:MAG: Gfo/Idh/MocA family oxidoreductase [Bryobacteraceae bacterium]|nr:Gfo/Idh/MocA family oxidoreductase [Bryobacteraceae bacterium]
MDRRAFLVSASAAHAMQSSNLPRVGLIGAGGRGKLLTAEFKEVGATVGAVCDVYQPNLEAGLKAASTGATAFSDYRKLLEDKSVQAVIVATPDHWHARMVIDAVNAGKDVYVEKPMTHEAAEAFDVIAAVRRTKRIVQVGTQRRSSPLFQDGRALAQSGKLGDDRLVTSQWLNYQAGLNMRPLDGTLDWKQWLGKAPQREMDPVRFRNWYYYWDYSGGLLIGQAAHMVDSIQWFMGTGVPSAVTCAGGQVNLKPAEIPETASINLEYSQVNLFATFTLGYKAMRYHTHNDQMAQYHGSKARLDVGRESYTLWPEQGAALQLRPDVTRDEPGAFNRATREHIRNFLDCIRSRKDPNAPVEEGMKTAVALVMTLESLRSGRRVKWDAANRRIV